MKIIKKIKLFNFKKFKQFQVSFDPKMNLLIGDNEAGKSSVLLAMDLLLSGSRTKVETVGLEHLFNSTVVKDFLGGTKEVDKLPRMSVEMYLDGYAEPDLYGRNNSDDLDAYGLRMDCAPIDEYSKEIRDVLDQSEANFPFEYYSIRFATFADQAYTGNRRFLRHIVIDSSQINNDYASREYTRSLYGANATTTERTNFQNAYRRHKTAFRDTVLGDLNAKLAGYQFAVKTSARSNLETDLVITEDDIQIEHKGKGRQCFIKTEFALRKDTGEHKIDALLLEEPENHLSHVNMRRLVQRIQQAEAKQLFVATHSSLICTRLDLRRAILMNSNANVPLLLKELSEPTASFFMKAPDNNLLEFIMSKKVILVEGDAEFILLEALYRNEYKKGFEDDNIHVISIGGTSFKRYLDVAKILGIRTAIIRDNDGDHDKNCIKNYEEYVGPNASVFADRDNSRSTFEICFYQANVAICDSLFASGRKSLSVQEYMLQEKAEVAFQLLTKKSDEVVSPSYIKDAFEWIRK